MMTEGFTLPPTPTPSGERTTGDDFVAQINSSAPPAGTGGPSATEAPALVFVGMNPAFSGDDTPRGYGSTTTGNGGPNLVPVSVLLDNFEDLERWQQRQLALLLAVGGYLGELDLENVAKVARNASYARILDAYGDLLDNAAARAAAGQRVTPEQLINQAVSFRLGVDWDGNIKGLRGILKEKGVTDAEKEEDEGPHTSTQSYSSTNTSTDTSTQVTRSIMDPDDAMALTRGLMQQELGRDPTKEEMEDFIATLQHAQRTSPTRSKSTQTTTTTNSGTETQTSDQGEGSGNSTWSTSNSTGTSSSNTNRTGSTTTREGIGAAGLEDVALRKMRQNPDWAEWQAVGTYTPALFAALGATVPGV